MSLSFISIFSLSFRLEQVSWCFLCQSPTQRWKSHYKSAFWVISETKWTEKKTDTINPSMIHSACCFSKKNQTNLVDFKALCVLTAYYVINSSISGGVSDTIQGSDVLHLTSSLLCL